MKARLIDGHVERLDAVKRPKKCTGTRFGAILGENKWSTPFEAWCAITRTYEEPFEDTIYTIAGKVIEPKQAAFMERSYGMTIVRPEDVYGKDYFKVTRGDFFQGVEIFGGMWDYIAKDDETGDMVLEMKTTKRVEDWQDGAIPEYYALQAALYARLLGLDDVCMVCSVLVDSDYEHPDDYVPTAHNTFVRQFKVSERYPYFDGKMKYVRDWWQQYVVTGISPPWDVKKDADILKALRTHVMDETAAIGLLISEAEEIMLRMIPQKKALEEDEKRLKELKELIKQRAAQELPADADTVKIPGKQMEWVLKVSKRDIPLYDIESMMRDGVYDKYVTVKNVPVETLSVKMRRE